MAYIGSSPTSGDFVLLDSITTSATASYTMQRNSVNFEPQSANHMIVSLNGTIQAPVSSFTVSGSTLTFASALTSSDVIDFILVLGNVNDVGTATTVVDSAITNNKLNLISTSSTPGLTVKGDGSSENGTIQLNCSQNSHGVKLSSPAHSAGQSYELILPTGNVTADKFLKVASVSGSGATGIGQLSFADAGGGAFTRVGGSSSTSSASYVDFDNVFTSTYTQYLITVACQFASNDSHLKLRMRASGSVDSGSGEYSWIVGGRGVSGTSESGIGNGQGDSSDDSYQCNQWGASDNKGENIFLQIHVRNPLPSTTSNAEGNYVMFQNTATVWTSDNYMTIQHGGGRKGGATDNDGIRFYPSTGNFRTYDIDIYGLQGS